MRKQILIYSIFITAMLSNYIIAQSEAAFQSLIYPRTLTSSGMGEQGAASRSAIDAMQYNPANLTYAKGTSFSLYRNPFNLYGMHIPLTSININHSLRNGSVIGLEYTDWDYGDLPISDEFGNSSTYRYYERSIGGGYQIKLCFGEYLSQVFLQII